MRDHYETVDESKRISEGLGRLELERTREVVRRWLPDGPLRVLDLGGATGVHARWLLEDGHAVHLVDPVELHVEQAVADLGTVAGFTAEVGDARALTADDAGFDAVLMAGPLYHLTERRDRVRAWDEARRVVRIGGFVFGATISRFASLFDSIASANLLEEPTAQESVAGDVATGQHRNVAGNPEWFTTAYFHHSYEAPIEAEEARLVVRDTVALEGFAGWFKHLAASWDDPASRELLLWSARVVEHEPSLAGVSAHQMVVAERTS